MFGSSRPTDPLYRAQSCSAPFVSVGAVSDSPYPCIVGISSRCQTISTCLYFFRESASEVSDAVSVSIFFAKTERKEEGLSGQKST